MTGLQWRLRDVLPPQPRCEVPRPGLRVRQPLLHGRDVREPPGSQRGGRQERARVGLPERQEVGEMIQGCHGFGF